LVFGLRLCCSLRTVLAVSGVFTVMLFLLVTVGSLRVPPASVPGAHAFASCARDLKLKCRSFHCYLGGPPAIPWLTRHPQASGVAARPHYGGVMPATATGGRYSSSVQLIRQRTARNEASRHKLPNGRGQQGRGNLRPACPLTDRVSHAYGTKFLPSASLGHHGRTLMCSARLRLGVMIVSRHAHWVRRSREHPAQNRVRGWIKLGEGFTMNTPRSKPPIRHTTRIYGLSRKLMDRDRST
jgi:hypothetical protein